MLNPHAHPSFSIVIETDNTEVSGIDDLGTCLDSLALQQPLLSSARGIFLVNSGTLPPSAGGELARRYPWLTLVRAPSDTRYIGMKLKGAELTDSEVIVFFDGDLRCEPGWLEALLDVFSTHKDAQIVAGETSTPIRGPYGLAVALTFVFPRFTGEVELAPSPTYWANNVAVRRSLLERLTIPDSHPLYRGQNLLHSLALQREKLCIWRQPRARAWHDVLPPSDIVWRYLVLGRDASYVNRLTREGSGRPYLAAMAPDLGGGNPIRKLLGRVRQVVRANPLNAMMLPLALPIAGALGLCYLVGRARAGAVANRRGNYSRASAPAFVASECGGSSPRRRDCKRKVHRACGGSP
jgi:hypothetical protein